MKIRNLLVGSLIAALLVSLAPTPQALADGAASTRNIIMGIGAAAATLIIINHNKKVHEKYAQDAATEAALANQRNDAQAAYRAEVRAYNHQVAVTDSLKKEVAIDNKLIAQQKQQLAQVGIHQDVTVAPVVTKSGATKMTTAQVVSYGWGTL
jgi:LytS/YehU family sensor histidine kinase